MAADHDNGVNVHPEPDGTDSHIEEQLQLMPDRPGVYLFRNAEDDVIYVGKALSLRSRVRSYFRSSNQLTPKVQLLVSHIRSIEHIVTENEVEALILESNLIKRYRPRYNIRLRDDKQYPYIRVSVQEQWPRVSVVRRVDDDGARYFGPFTQSERMRDTLKLLRRLFPYRSCSDRRLQQGGPPCLYYHIKRCNAPCDGLVSEEEYRREIQGVVQFLEGNRQELVKRLQTEMEEAAESLRFEEAAQLRDQLLAIEATRSEQKVSDERISDRDVIALARTAPDGEGVLSGEAAVQVFMVREGKVSDREQFLLEATAEEEDGAIMAAFLQQFYHRSEAPPPEILVSHVPNEIELIERWLGEQAGRRVRLHRPQRGEKRRLMEMVLENAQHSLALEAERRFVRREGSLRAQTELQEALDLSKPPVWIECFDISNLQGSHTVAAQVVFIDGRPDKKSYRKYRIRNVQGPNDYASMAEVIQRRFRLIAEGIAEGESPPLPDLVVIDGGKGQLNIAMKALEELGIADHLELVGLAEEAEQLFRPGTSEPILLSFHSPGLQLLQRVRDEAHRFALGYHRQLRGKESVRSILEEVPGIGPRRRKALLLKYRSLARLAQATPEELAQVPGMTRSAAETLHDFLKQMQLGSPI